jgi:hypothetical protein
MKSPLLRLLVSLALIHAASESASAGDITFHTEDPASILRIVDSNWGEFGVWSQVSKEWGKETYKGDKKEKETLEDAPGKMKRKHERTAPTGESVSILMDATANGSVVDLTTVLESASPLPGSFHVILNVPLDVATDLTVLADGKPMTTNLDRGAIRNKPGEVSLVKTSTGQVILKATGEMGSARTHFFKDHENRPLSVWFAPAEKVDEQTSPFAFPLHFEFGTP